MILLPKVRKAVQTVLKIRSATERYKQKYQHKMYKYHKSEPECALGYKSPPPPQKKTPPLITTPSPPSPLLNLQTVPVTLFKQSPLKYIGFSLYLDFSVNPNIQIFHP